MSEGGEVVEVAGKLGLFKAIQAFFKRALKTGAEDAAKDAEKDLAKDLGKDTKKFSTKEMVTRWKNEDVAGPKNPWFPRGPVDYLDESGRQKYLLEARNGKLYDSNGNLFDTSGGSSVHMGGGGRAIFVMDENGNIYASNYQEVAKFHHSSFLSGEPVAGAGELTVTNGVPELLTPRSGHYQPTPEMTQQVFDQLQAQGVDLSRLKIDPTF